SLSKFTKNLEQLISSNAPRNEKEEMNILFTRYKEVSSEKPLEIKLENSTISTLFKQSTVEEDFYFELIAMRIAKLDNFESILNSPFKSVLESNDSELIQKIATRLENYIDFDDILLGLKQFNSSLLFTEIAKYLTVNDSKVSRADINTLIWNFKEICELGNINPRTLLIRLNGLDISFSDEINVVNVKEIVTPFFLEQSLLENIQIGNKCIETVKEYLNTLTKEQWKESLKNPDSYEIESSLIIDYKYSSNSFEAFKDFLNDISTGNTDELPNKDVIQNIIKKFVEQRKSLKATFNRVRDTICRLDSMNVALFKYFGEWLFDYSDLEKNTSSLRTIFITEVFENEDCLQIIFSNQEKMPAIISSAGEEAQDILEFIKEKLINNSSERFIDFAKCLGLEIDNMNN
ncbi:hypothetical protein, partial [Aquirufa beregesia]